MADRLFVLAGFGYLFLNKNLRDWLPGASEFSGRAADILSQPLVNQPGEKFQYGINIDWVGELIARASGLKLNDYLLKNVLEPIGAKDITMLPTEDMKNRLASMHQRSPDGTLKLREGSHIMGASLDAMNSGEANTVFQSGGAGCFGVPSEYCSKFLLSVPYFQRISVSLTLEIEIIATLLNDGTHPKTGAQLLKPETVKGQLRHSLFENLLSQTGD